MLVKGRQILLVLRGKCQGNAFTTAIKTSGKKQNGTISFFQGNKQGSLEINVETEAGCLGAKYQS